MAELDRPAIARRITQAREEAGLTQAEMADALSVHPRTYWNYEDEDPRTPWGLMNDIAKVTGKTTEWLIHGDQATPELLAKLSSGDQVEDIRAEFRRRVDTLDAKLDLILSLLGEEALQAGGRALTEIDQDEAEALSALAKARAGKGRRRRAG